MKKVLKINQYKYGFLFLIFLILILFWVIKTSNKMVWAKTTTRIDTKVITLEDSDGDGLLDENDPHPNIAEIYIVADENKNGIADDFEK